MQPSCLVNHCPGVEVVDALPKCIGLRPGELCEGDGECGTDNSANRSTNHGTNHGTNYNGPFVCTQQCQHQ